MYESDVDFKIYNRKTHEIICEKSLGIFDNKKFGIVAAVNECVGYLESHQGDFSMCTPFRLGHISDYMAAELILRKLIDRHIGKNGLFNSKQDTLFALHEPLSAVEKKAFEDMGHLIGHGDVTLVECTNDWLAKYKNWEEVIWDLLDSQDKHCRYAIEFTKADRSGFAELAVRKLIFDGMRWGFSKEEMIDMIKNCDESKLRKTKYHCY